MGLVSCSERIIEEDLPSGPAAAAFEERPLVPVYLYLNTAGYVDVVDGEFAPQTKAAEPYDYHTQSGDDQKIYNLWILEFEQIGDQFVLNAQPTYIADFPSYFEGGDPATGAPIRTKTIGIPASRYNCRLLFMANTGLPGMTFSPGTTLEQFKEARFAEIDGQVDLFGWDEDAGLWAPRFNGTVETRVNTSTLAIPEDPAHESVHANHERVSLKRAMARVDITLTNYSLRSPDVPANERVTIHLCRINNVQNRSFYYTNYEDYEESITLNRPNVAAPLSVTDPGYDWIFNTYVRADWGRMISYGEWYKNGVVYDTSGKTDAECFEDGAVPTTATARFFVPGNLRPSSDMDATSITLTGTYVKEGNQYEVSYDIPIRENHSGQMVNAVRPNHKYVFNVNIRRLGDTDVDEFADNGLVDYTSEELANSYILNPSPLPDISKVFKFPVMKPNLFWGDEHYAASQTVITSASPVGEKQGRDLVIGEDDVWRAFILWSDFDPAGKLEMVDLHHLDADGNVAGGSGVAGLGKGTDPTGTGCFAVRVKGGTSGNAVIALERTLKKDSKTWTVTLWTWHLWITDYNPDYPISPDGDTYNWWVHPVTGGRVFRMNNWMFTSGRLKKSYVMDRPLGALQDPVSLIDTYLQATLPDDIKNLSRRGLGLYYYFGMKDPVPGTATVWYSTGDTGYAHTLWQGNTSQYRLRFGRIDNWGNLVNRTYYTTVAAEPSSMVAFYTMFPLTHHANKNSWTNNDKYNPTEYSENILWQDPWFFLRENEDASNKLGYRKSMFDPCPPGWSLPYKQVSGNTEYNYVDEIPAKAGTYWRYWQPITVSGDYRGFYLWPDGREIPNAEITRDKRNNSIFFYRPGHMGIAFDVFFQANLQLWSAHPISTTKARRFNFGDSGLDSRYQESERSNAYHIRCVRNVKPD